MNFKKKDLKFMDIGRKKAQMQFNWIFSIVVGAVIIFLALFFASRSINMQQYKYDSEIAEKLSVLLDPLESGMGSASIDVIKMPADTRISMKCKYEGIGRQELRIATKNSVGSEWQEFGAIQSIYNKYVFSRDLEEGKELYIFSKQFKMPFDVANLIYLTAGNYCFISPPDSLSYELKDLNATNMKVTNRKQDCKKGSISVCFNNPSCDVVVNGLCYGYGCNSLYDYGYVQQGNEKSYFLGDALLYGAIFSKPDFYNCTVKRLLNRISMLSKLYAEKTKLLDSRGCMTGELSKKLIDLSYEASGLIALSNIMPLNDKSIEVEYENEALICRAW
ncbi:MAG: hypothetical protein V1660_03940 [archaeon]